MSIRAKNINYTYNKGTPDEVHAIKNLSFDIEDGEFIGVIGHTASGKSTLMQILNGLIKFDSGELEVSGHNFNSENTSLTELRKKVGLVFQYPEYQLFEESVELDIAFGPKNLGYSEDKINQLVNRALSAVGLNEEAIKKSSPFELSGGQMRKVAIAGVLAMDPEVLIMDEPASGLDPKARVDIMNMIKAEHKKMGRITIVVSHEMRDIAKTCDRIMVLNKGELFAYATPEDIFKERNSLINIGLDFPEITYVSSKLNEKGFDIDMGIYEVERWAKELALKMDELRGK